jgi:hypothetical protein
MEPGSRRNVNHLPANRPAGQKGSDIFWANVFANSTGSDRMLA